MKKIAVIIVLFVFIIGTLVSCNKNVCPAYVDHSGAQTHQSAENNS